jgi:hypothetical protein
MKIEKKRVTGKTQLSTAVKGSIATALGMASTFTLNACIGAESGSVMAPEPDPTPTCGEVACEPQSSSSNVLDIPKSQERLSSSALEALSSAAKMSSSSNEPPLSAGVPFISSPSSTESSSSSTATPVSSSLEEPIPLSGDIAPFEDSSSSSEIQSSSSEEAQSSSSRPTFEIITIEPEPDTLIQKPFITPEERCDPSSPDCYNVHLCRDSNNCMIFSMVTTFEQDDVQA